MSSGLYERFLANLMNKIVDLEADTIKVALMTVSHSFTSTHNVWGDVSANEITGTGYTAGGKVLASKTVAQGSPTVWDAGDVSWAGATLSTYHGVLYDDTTTNDDLIASIDFGGEQAVTGEGNFTIGWNINGIITLT